MGRLIDVGVQLPEVERVVRWPENRAMTQAAEEVGFDSVWVGDHLIYRDDGGPERGPWEAWTFLAAIAAVTERVKIGPLVACAGFHDAAMLAKIASTVDDIAGGRLVFGIGAGWNTPDFTAFDVPFDHRVSRFEETFEVLRRLFAGERVTYDGTYVHIDDCVLLPEPEHRIPLMVGSNGDRMLSIALPHADAWNTWYDDYGNSVEGFLALNARITAAAEAVGRDPAQIRRSACVLVSLEGSANSRPYDKECPPIEAGDPSTLVAHLGGLAEAGADEAILVVDPITERSIRTLGDALENL